MGKHVHEEVNVHIDTEEGVSDNDGPEDVLEKLVDALEDEENIDVTIETDN